MSRKGYIHPSRRSGPYTPSRGRFAKQTFPSYRQYQNATARAKGFGSALRLLASPKRVTVKDGASALARPSRIRALDALNRIYHGETIEQAAREAGTTVPTVKRYAGSGLRKTKSGRIVARKSDHLAAVMKVITEAGAQELIVVGSRSRRLNAEHNAAVAQFLDTSNVSYLTPFIGETINVEGVEIPLVTDPHILTRLGREGRLSFESVYVSGIAA